MKKIKVFYRRNLKMTPGKLAAQSCHAVLGLSPEDYGDTVVVLTASDAKFFELIDTLKQKGIKHHVVTDAGRTELEPGTQTCVAYVCEV